MAEYMEWNERMDSPREECGVIGVSSPIEEVAQLVGCSRCSIVAKRLQVLQCPMASRLASIKTMDL
ncbi:MAG: hypothetical protein RL628_1869 [Actinomycetota bacterium]